MIRRNLPFLLAILAVALISWYLPGCALLPAPLAPTPAQAAAQNQSNLEEGTYLVLGTVDTLQQLQLVKHPACFHEPNPFDIVYGGRHPSSARVLLTGLAVMTVHTMVTSWLDDRVAAEIARGQGDGWYRTRDVWHIASLGLMAGIVTYNYRKGLTPTAARCDP